MGTLARRALWHPSRKCQNCGSSWYEIRSRFWGFIYLKHIRWAPTEHIIYCAACGRELGTDSTSGA